MAQSPAESSAVPDGTGRAMLLRIVSALVLAGIAGAAVALGWPVFSAFVGLFAVLMAWEWGRLCSGRGIGSVSVALPIPVAAIGIAAGSHRYDIAIALALGCAPAIHLLALLSGARGAAWSAVGPVYVGLPLAAFLWIYDRPGGWMAIVWLVAVVIATDTGAYFVGRKVGGPKLAPRISPSKTWAGLLGGVLCAAVVGEICSYVLLGVLIWSPALIGAVAALIAQAGDLFESVVKRQFGVKDSSGILPGHGGLLDRVDGLVAVATAAAIAMWASGGTIQV
jgi:phosphatidate cytidylyltransferase